MTEMRLLVALFAYGILRVVDPAPDGPLYLLVEPECAAKGGWVEVRVTNPYPSDPPPQDPVGVLIQGKTECDVEQVVTAGP